MEDKEMTNNLIKENPMLKDKKKLTYLIIVILLAIAIITTGTVLVLKAMNNTKKVTETTLTPKAQADTTKAQAIEAIKNKDTTKAKTLLKEANQQYKEVKDTNNVVDTNALLCLQGVTEYCSAGAK
jgi:ABC-type lipoprotein release transport system permease subunit